MRFRQHYDFVERTVDFQATVGKLHMLLVSVRGCSLVWSRVVDLLIMHRFTLRRVTNSHAGYSTQRFVAFVLVAFRLLEARVDAAHHLSANHADLVENYQLRTT